MMRIAMVNHGTVVMALFLVAPLLLGTVVVGESSNSTTTTEPGSDWDDWDVSMINLNETVDNYYRPRERRLATATVWCVSIPGAANSSLQSSLDWACGPLANQGQLNCGPISSGGACFSPDTVAHHCDWAFNAYFHGMNATSQACNFGGTAQQVFTDPSSGTCVFQGSNITTNGSTPTTPTGVAPANSPLSPAGSPIYSPNAAPPIAAWQPHYSLLRFSTALILLTYLFT